jgi:hypothetical protein
MQFFPSIFSFLPLKSKYFCPFFEHSPRNHMLYPYKPETSLHVKNLIRNAILSLCWKLQTTHLIVEQTELHTNNLDSIKHRNNWTSRVSRSICKPQLVCIAKFFQVWLHNIKGLNIVASNLETGVKMRIQLWDVAIYICKDNHLSNCSIIFITIAQYTQMYLNN